MKTEKNGQRIKRSRAAQKLGMSIRTLQRYESKGLLTPIKLNSRVVLYSEEEVQKIANGEVMTAKDVKPAEPLPRSAEGTWQPRKNGHQQRSQKNPL